MRDTGHASTERGRARARMLSELRRCALNCAMLETAALAASPGRRRAWATASSRHAWVRRHALVAATAGAALGVAGIAAVRAVGRPELRAAASHEIAAGLYLASCWLVLGLALGALTSPLVGTRFGRRAAVSVSVAVFSALAVLHTIDVVQRIVSGTYLSLEFFAFASNGSEHLWHAAKSEYAVTAAVIPLLLAAFALGFARPLRCFFRDAAPIATAEVAPGQHRPVVSAAALSLALSLLTLVTFVFLGRETSAFARGMFASGPLLGIASSMANRDAAARAHYGAHDPATPHAWTAPEGPPRTLEASFHAHLAQQQPSARPNVVLFLLESIAPSHLGFMGYPRPTSPNIDRLAQEGLELRRTWATATHSNYSQMALLSSLFPRRGNGLDQYTRLDYPRFLFHDLFAALGYDTATISSQDEDWQGMRRFQDTGTPTFFWHSRDFTGAHLDSGVERTVPDEHTASKVIEWLTTKRARPFAVYVNFQGTHFPYALAPGNPRPFEPDNPPAATFTYFRYPESSRPLAINRYDNALAHVDRQIGRVLTALETSGVLDDTLVVLTADHGEQFFERGLVTHGQTLHEIEARVPLILRWPRHIAPERRLEPVSHLDVLPTIAELVQAPVHPSWQGESVRLPRPVNAAPRPIYLTIQGIRLADALVCWPYKIIYERAAAITRLFHLERDPDELEDLAEAEPLVAGRLSGTFERQLAAQLRYHDADHPEARTERFAPRLRGCPSVP
ncbi:MAG: DUF229 domain-containing protein [Myxococcales bacterium]|nr:DUF229 domain-containing protein [Myxococcales bacterium]